MKPWIVGESNPYRPDRYFALYPVPAESAGGRLCRKVFGMREAEYLRSFERVNLLSAPKWSVPAARKEACRLIAGEISPYAPVVLLGAKVFAAFAPWMGVDGEQPWAPFAWRHRYLLLPHPSGLSRAWNEPGAFRRAQVKLIEGVPELRHLVGVVPEDMEERLRYTGGSTWTP